MTLHAQHGRISSGTFYLPQIEICYHKVQLIEGWFVIKKFSAHILHRFYFNDDSILETDKI